MSARAVTVLVAAAVMLPSLAAAAPRAAERHATARAELRGKPTGPIAVEYRLAAQLEVGVPVEIVVTARVDAAATGLALEANASTPRAVLVTPPTLVTAAAGLHSWRFTVVPLEEEAGYLSVIVAGSVDGITQASTVTVPLRTAAPHGTAPAAGRAASEKLISLPVQESP